MYLPYKNHWEFQVKVHQSFLSPTRRPHLLWILSLCLLARDRTLLRDAGFFLSGRIVAHLKFRWLLCSRHVPFSHSMTACFHKLKDHSGNTASKSGKCGWHFDSVYLCGKDGSKVFLQAFWTSDISMPFASWVCFLHSSLQEQDCCSMPLCSSWP